MFGIELLLKLITEFARAANTLIEFRVNPEDFTRKRKLTLPKLLSFLMSNTRASAQIELNKSFKNMGGGHISKQAYFEAREKFKPELFREMNTQIMKKSNAHGGFKTLHGFRVIAVDGSIFEVPASASSDFGALNTNGNPVAKGQTIAFVDVLNKLILAAGMEEFTANERQMALEIFETCKLPKKVIYLFDRGFYSIKQALQIQKNKAKFVFRVKRKCQKDIDDANLPDQEITIENLKMRVINFILPNGENERLVTNILDDSFSVNDFGELYNLRWGIETTFLILKERLKIEKFSSGKKQLILQDFYASIVAYNLLVFACAEKEREIAKRDKINQNKNEHKPNMNVTLPEIQNCIIMSICGTKVQKANALVDLSVALMQNPSPERPDRHFPHEVKNPSAKYPLNKK